MCFGMLAPNLAWIRVLWNIIVNEHQRGRNKRNEEVAFNMHTQSEHFFVNFCVANIVSFSYPSQTCLMNYCLIRSEHILSCLHISYDWFQLVSAVYLWFGFLTGVLILCCHDFYFLFLFLISWDFLWFKKYLLWNYVIYYDLLWLLVIY